MSNELEFRTLNEFQKLEDRIKVLEYNLAYLARIVETACEFQGLPNTAREAKNVRDYYQESRI